MEENIFKTKVRLSSGVDGNTFSIISVCAKAARRNKIGIEDIDKFKEEALQGNYDHALQTCMKYFDVN